VTEAGKKSFWSQLSLSQQDTVQASHVQKLTASSQ